MRECKKCNIKKEEEYFVNCGGGRKTNTCKECKNKGSRERYKRLMSKESNREAERERCREKYYRLGYKKSSKSNIKTMKKWQAKFPEKRAGSIASRDVKIKTKGNHRHHWSYNKQHYKSIIELSVREHYLLHRFLIYDQERFMYRCTRNCGSFKSGDLLDTKYRHIKYYLYLRKELINQNINSTHTGRLRHYA